MREPRWVKVARVVVLAALGVFTLAPIYALVSSSVKPLVDVQSTFRWIPSRLTLRPFVDIWHTVPLGRYFLNSVVVSGVAMACSVTVAMVAAYAFTTAWGEVLFASVMTDEGSRTLAVGLQGYATSNDVYWNQVMATSLVVSVPVVIGFLALQRHFVAGLTAGAVK